MRFLHTIAAILMLSCACNDKQQSASDSNSPTVASNITWDDCGYKISEHPCNFSLNDANGEVFNLYDHYGDVILIDFSTMWCHYCQVAGGHAQAFQDKYGHHGFKYITILIEDNYGNSVEQSDLQHWVDTFGITTSPVLAGDRTLVDLNAENGYPISGWPTFVLINREMVLEYGVNGWSEELVTSWVEDVIGRQD